MEAAERMRWDYELGGNWFMSRVVSIVYGMVVPLNFMSLFLFPQMTRRSPFSIDKSTTSYGSYLADLYRSQESSIVILVDADTPPPMVHTI